MKMAAQDHYAVLALPSPLEPPRRSALPPPTPTDIKLAYHRALLHHHPDRAHRDRQPPNAPVQNGANKVAPAVASPTATSAPRAAAATTQPLQRRSAAQQPTVDDIRAAYATLSDPVLKRDYDRALRLARQHRGPTSDGVSIAAVAVAAEAVDLDDMDFKPQTATGGGGGGTWTRKCPRCGPAAEGFTVDEATLEAAASGGEGGGGEVMVQCAGCSLWIRITFAVADDEDENPNGG